MKKIIVAVMVLTMFVSACQYEHNYTREDCKVIQVNDGYATIEDKNGFVWDFGHR